MLGLKVLGRLRFFHILADLQLFLYILGLVLKQLGKMVKKLKYQKVLSFIIIKVIEEEY